MIKNVRILLFLVEYLTIKMNIIKYYSITYKWVAL